MRYFVIALFALIWAFMSTGIKTALGSPNKENKLLYLDGKWKWTHNSLVPKFTSKNGNRFVEVTLDGYGPLYFLVNSKAPRTAVTKDVVAKLRLPIFKYKYLINMGDESSFMSGTHVNKIKVGGITFNGLDMVVLESRPISKDHIDGVLGLDILKHVMPDRIL